jgi:GTP cyclohydrolase IB
MSPADSLLPGQRAQRMPDVAHDARPQLGGSLDRVGMAGIEVPVRLRDDSGALVLVPAKAEAYVGLDDPEARGIHMSRLFLALQSILDEEELSLGTIRRLLDSFVASHAAISRSAAVRLTFDLPIKRQALVSPNQAWRIYPVSVSGESSIDDGARPGQAHFRLGARVAYSSTCPCSAALARQLIQERFRADFADQGMIDAEVVAAWLGRERSIAATPHSQRSYADVLVEVRDLADVPTFVELIDLAEGALGTAVQAAVKREDEQEFARLNAANLMFCEDAGRRLKAALDADPRVRDWRVQATHVESLHPHDAVSIAVKGVPGGLRP